jgi:hypothetical protein
VDRLAVLVEGLLILSGVGAHCFPFVAVVGNDPGSVEVGVDCPKIKPVFRVWGQLGHLRDNFCVAAMMVHLVVLSNSSTCSVSSSSAGV